MPVDKNSIDENNRLFRAKCCNVHKTNFIETINRFLSSSCVKIFNSTNRSLLLRLRQAIFSKLLDLF